MMLIFRIAAAIELALTGIEGCFHWPTFLPLGGGHLSQIAFVFIAAFVTAEIVEALSQRRKGWGQEHRRPVIGVRGESDNDQHLKTGFGQTHGSPL